jgi:DNA polymerase-1
MGDSSDHIYGVPGVGEKTAQKLIAEFHSLEGIYANLDAPSIAKGVRAKLESGKESAYDSRWLATICREVPLGLSLSELSYGGIDKAGFYEKCTALEFTQFIRKLGLAPRESVEPQASTAPEKPCNGICEAASAEALLAAFPTGSRFAVSYEGGFAFSDGERTLLYEGEVEGLAPLFDGSRTVITHDGKRLLHRLWSLGVDADFVPRDVMLYAYILGGGGQNDLGALSVRYLDACPAEGEASAPYILRLEEVLAARIAEIDGKALLEEIELPLSPVLARMERAGFRLDTEGLSAFGKRLSDELVMLTESITSLAGVDFNLNSPKQLAEVLFEHLMLPTKGIKKNKNGYSTDVDTLDSLRRYHPIIDEILAYRQFSKLYSTYAVGLLKVADENGDIHTDFKQALTATGRLSSAEPNLQNIPIRTALGRELRRVFIPKSAGYVLVDADYSQIELRLLAAFSGDERMCEAFITGEDIHKKTAAAVFRVPEYAVTDELRSRAKAVNFGIVYGISAFSLSNDIGVSVAEAKRYMEDYFAQYPKIKAYLDKAVADAERDGYTATCFGRRRYIPELSSKVFALRAFGKRVAMNSPIQGSAADMIKIAMVRVDRRLKDEGLDAHLVMQVHDELIVEARIEDAEHVRTILKEEMEGAASLAVPLTVSTAVGANWLEAEH